MNIIEKLTCNENNKLILVNLVEELVKQKVDIMIKKFDMCDCYKCRLNTCAIALNSIPSHYVTTEKGLLLGTIDCSEFMYQASLSVEITKALMIVKENPYH